MSKHTAQLQKSMSLPQFLSEFGCENQCRETLFRLRRPDGFRFRFHGQSGASARSPTHRCDPRRGQQLTYHTAGITRIESTDPTIATAWQSGQLQYRGEPLKYVIKGVNRYSSKGIIIVDIQVEGFLFIGSAFQDQADDWLKGLTEIFPVKVVETGANKLLLEARAEP